MKSKLIILSIATLLGCVSCNTIGGVGKDVEAFTFVTESAPV